MVGVLVYGVMLAALVGFAVGLEHHPLETILVVASIFVIGGAFASAASQSGRASRLSGAAKGAGTAVLALLASAAIIVIGALVQGIFGSCGASRASWAILWC